MNDIKYVVNFAQDVQSTEYGSCLVKLYPVRMWNTLYLSFMNPCDTSSKVVTCICTAEKTELMGTVLQFDIICVSTMCGLWL